MLFRSRGRHTRRDRRKLLAHFASQATLAIEVSRIFSRLGQALFESAALVAPGQELRDALAQRAAQAPRPNAELAELALLFHDLGQLGADERRVAAQIAEDFLAYARKQRR